jgi:hypothetical protein
MENKSILTWRDIYLNGGRAAINVYDLPMGAIQRLHFVAGAAVSFNGYQTDDDANNHAELVSSGSTEALVLDFDFSASLYEYASDYITLDRKIGVDFSWIKLEHLDMRAFYRDVPRGDIDGLVNVYDIYKLGFYGDVKTRIIESDLLYADLSGQTGLSLAFGVADWMYRTDYKHPVSFLDVILFFRGKSEFELGLMIKQFTLFTKLQAGYEVSPGLTWGMQYLTSGEIPIQTKFVDLFRAAFTVGVKGSF